MLMLLKMLTLMIIFTNGGNLCKADPLAGMIESTAEGEFPFVVSIGRRYDISQRDPYGHVCGGALITMTHVLTSAHCFFDTDTIYDYFVYVGSIDLQNSTIYYIQDWIKYDRWPEKRRSSNCHYFKDNDIAIAMLIGSVSSEITLPRVSTSRPESFDNGYAITAGWGLFDDTVPRILVKADLHIISHSVCAHRIHQREPEFILERNFICTNGSGVLFVILNRGDSGSPLIVRHPNNVYEIIGVNDGCMPKATNWLEILDEQNMHISVYYYLSFIKKVANLDYLELE